LNCLCNDWFSKHSDGSVVIKHEKKKLTEVISPNLRVALSLSPACCSQHRSSDIHFYRGIPRTAQWMDEPSHDVMLLVQLSGS
jgi:hypothetical protein